MIPTLAAALEQRGYTTLTPVQEAVTDPALGNADLLVSAQTGSGKTVGFGLAIAPTLLDGADSFGPAGKPLALIVAPTRELAMQVKRELAWLYAQAGAVIASTVGGMDMRDERRTLERGAHVVVATPGRLRDHIMRNSLDMSAIRAIVLDEADEMLDLGFREDLEYILGSAPETRRTLMFSATVPASIAKLAQNFQKAAVRVTTVAERSQHADIDYRALSVAPQDAENAIINVLRYYESPNALVFANTRVMVTRLTTRLSNRGFAVVALSGELSQTERSHALQAMRDGRARVCVATDVAARGIDLPNLDLVVHAELPQNAEVLLHRSGRTGRAGNKGVSTFIVPPKLRRKAEMLLRGAKVTAEWAAPPSADEVIARDRERLVNDPVWTEGFSDSELEFADTLLARHDAKTIAAAYLRLYANKTSAPEDLSDPGTVAAPAPRKAFGPSRWFSVNVGRDDRAEARWLLPLLCNAGGITKDDIGAIRIQPTETYVEISEASAGMFLHALGPKMKLEGGAEIVALKEPPVMAARGPRTDGPRPTPRAKPQEFTPPPPSAAPEEPAILAQSTPDFAPDVRKPRHTKPTPRPAPVERDHGDAVKPYKGKSQYDDKPKPRGDATPYKSKAKAPYKTADGKPGGKKPYAKPDGDRPAYRARTDAASDGGKPAYKGKPGPKKPYDKGPAPAATAPRQNASDTSKRFTPPGAKQAPRPGKSTFRGKGGNATPKRGGPKPR